MASSFANGILRRLDDLSDEELLTIHREVCRRAAAIYEPMYREKRRANHRIGMMAGAAKRGQ